MVQPSEYLGREEQGRGEVRVLCTSPVRRRANCQTPPTVVLGGKVPLFRGSTGSGCCPWPALVYMHVHRGRWYTLGHTCTWCLAVLWLHLSKAVGSSRQHCDHHNIPDANTHTTAPRHFGSWQQATHKQACQQGPCCRQGGLQQAGWHGQYRPAARRPQLQHTQTCTVVAAGAASLAPCTISHTNTHNQPGKVVPGDACEQTALPWRPTTPTSSAAALTHRQHHAITPDRASTHILRWV